MIRTFRLKIKISLGSFAVCFHWHLTQYLARKVKAAVCSDYSEEPAPAWQLPAHAGPSSMRVETYSYGAGSEVLSYYRLEQLIWHQPAAAHHCNTVLFTLRG